MLDGKIGSSEYSRSEIAPFPPVETEGQAIEFTRTLSAKTLDQVFSNNKITGTNLKVQRKKITFKSLLKSFATFIKSVGQAKVAQNDVKQTSKNNAVNFVPQLDPPENLPLDLRTFKLPQLAEPTSQFSDKEIFKELANLTDRTMYEMLRYVLLMQNELAHESALISMDDFEQFQKMQVYQQKVLKEIKELLLKDDHLREKFKTVQNIGALVTAIATATSFLGFTIPFAFVAGAVSGAVGSGGSAYFKHRTNKDTAVLVELKHKVKMAENRRVDAAEKMEMAVNNVENEKMLSKILRDQLKLCESIRRRR